jgi:hypothetical protein
MEQELAAGLSERQVAELVEDDEVHPGQMLGDPPLPSVAGLDPQAIDEVDHVVEAPAGVRKEDNPLLPSSFSDNREPVDRAAAGASTATRLTVQFISLMIRLIAATTSPAACRKGAADVISLLPRPRGIMADKLVGIASGVRGWAADTTQIGNFLWRAHATSIPMKTADDTTQAPLTGLEFRKTQDTNRRRRKRQMARLTLRSISANLGAARGVACRPRLGPIPKDARDKPLR